jgi:hypothetical protein
MAAKSKIKIGFFSPVAGRPSGLGMRLRKDVGHSRNLKIDTGNLEFDTRNT